MAKTFQQLLKSSSTPEVLEKLELWISVLSKIDTERRASYIEPIIATFDDVNASYLTKIAERESLIAGNQMKYETAVAAQEVSKQSFRLYGIYGFAGGLAILVLVSLFLAHFSIERQLRIINNIVVSMQHIYNDKENNVEESSTTT